MENNNKKKLVLDYSTWRCGGDTVNINKLGEGNTQLLNRQGFMCCLGQFSMQLNETIANNPQLMLGKGEPYEVEKEIPDLVYSDKSYRDDESDDYDILYVDSDLSAEAIFINDKCDTTPEEKIVKLKELFDKYDYEIEVINHQNCNQEEKEAELCEEIV